MPYDQQLIDYGSFKVAVIAAIGREGIKGAHVAIEPQHC